MSHRLRPGPWLLVLLAAASAGFSEDEDPRAEAEAWVRLAAPLVRRGDYPTARMHLEKARKADPANAEAVLLAAAVAERTGDARGAVDLVTALPPDVRTLTRRADLLLGLGDVAGAESAALEALKLDEDALPARRIVAAVLEETGKREAAAEQYADVNRRWARNENLDSDEDLLAVARARRGLYRVTDEYRVDLEGLVSRYEELLRRKEPPEDAYVEVGDLYLDAHRDLEAKRWFTKAAELNPHSAAAIFGLARQLAFRYDDIGAQREAERALAENPKYVPALTFLAGIALGDASYEKAEGRIREALAVNPEDGDARGLRAALHYLRGAEGAFEAEVKAILARNPFRSAAYRHLARALEEQRRFAEAGEFAERATAVDPRDWDAWFLAGRNAMNVGDDEKAEKFLRTAEKGDPFLDVYRTNFLKMYDVLVKFPVVRSERFAVRLPREIEEAYAPLILPAMERSLADLERRWEFSSATPVHVAIFDRQDDFAARTVGLPGFPALGACFGTTVTLDSPRALPPGAFGWRGTLHHEFAHVLTLQLSRGRVPRWLTEGASVYEERKASPVWDREMERDLVDAIASGEVLTLADVNNAFRGARVMYAYYQGGLMCEFVEKEFGFPKLREMVRLYGDDLPTHDVVQRALGIAPEEFDARFLAFARAFVKDLKVLPRLSSDAISKLRIRLRKEKDDADGWALLALGHAAHGDVAAALQALGKHAELRPGDARGSTIRALIAFRQRRPDQAVPFALEAIEKGDDTFDLRMLLADDAGTRKDFDAAKTHLRRAIELFPVASGPGCPRLRLAEMLMGEGEERMDEVMALLEAHVRIDEDDFLSRSRLAAFHRDRARSDDELRMREEMRDVVPLPNATWGREACTELHERLAQLYMEKKRWPEAEIAARLAAAVASMELRPREDPPLDDGRRADLVATHAETLHLLGRDDDARRRAEEALRLDPANERAGVLVEKLKP